MARSQVALIAVFVALAVSTAPARAQTTTYTWNDTTNDWLPSSSWTPSGPDWTQRDRLGDAIAAFGNQATIGSGTPTIFGNSLFANRITINNTGVDWNITGGDAGNPGGVLTLGSGGISVTGGGTSTITANINIARSQTWDVGSGATLNMGGVATVSNGSTGVLSGFGTLTKAGTGTLVIDNPGNTFTGTIAITAGTLQVGSATNNSAGLSLRNTAIDFGAGTGALTLGGSGQQPRMGQISGSNAGASVSAGAQTIHVHALGDASFAGSVSSTNGLSLYGPGQQTFTGNTTGLGGTLRLFSGSTLTLSGTGDTTSGVLGSTAAAVLMNGGTFVLDNTAGNTSAAGGRVINAATMSFTGGGSTLRLIGNAAGTTENVGNLNLAAGAHTVRVDHNGGADPTVLVFGNSATDFSLAPNSTAMTVNFVGTGGTLGAAGANPRIMAGGTGKPFIGTNTAMLSNSAGSDATIGWATVNGTEWAGYGANGIVALAPDITSGTNTGIQAATTGDLVVFNPTTNQTLTGNAASATFKITPGAASLSLNIGTNNLTTTALMLAGSTDFTITGSTGRVLTGASTRYVYVTDANAVLTLDGAAIANGQPVTKSGAGTLALTGSTNLLPFTSNQNVNVVQGTLRGTVAALGGGASAGGANTTINLIGGVLEIDGAGSGSAVNFTRAIGVSGTASGGGLFFNSGPQFSPGDGGFSAINAPGGVNIRFVDAVGGSTTAGLQWGDQKFVATGYALVFGSSKADSRVTLTNDIALDTNTATTYAAREVRVLDNASSAGDIATLSGTISGTSITDLVKTGTGTLELTGTNTYRGNTLVTSGTLWVNHTIEGGSGTGHGSVIVSKGATLGGVGRIGPSPDAGLVSMVVVQPGGLIRGGSTVGTTSERVGSLTIAASLSINSNSTDNSILRVEATHDTNEPGNARASLINVTGESNSLDLNLGSGKLVIDLVSGTNPLQVGQAYTLTLASVGTAGNIRLNGSSLAANSVISASSYTLQSADFTSFSNVSLAIDGAGTSLVLSFTATPVPEPATVLALAAAALVLGRAARRRKSA